MATDPQAALRDFQPKHKFFIGIDSDGCAFDTMEIKHKECFTPNIIKFWDLQGVSKYAREAAEFVNLYSKWRGVNRFPALVKVFDLLRERPEVIQRNVPICEATSLRKFIDSGVPLGNPGLEQYINNGGADDELKQALAWSEGVNATVEDMVHGIPPYPFLRESLEKVSDKADAMVVSATPCEALDREWAEHGIDQFVEIIAGQEMGKKSEHLDLATKGKYEPQNVLMIGDALGDFKAAEANNALFYPIIPSREEESWELFLNEASDKFFAGEYAGDYQAQRMAEFQKYLPEVPPWKK